jgi:hypothetical protein
MEDEVPPSYGLMGPSLRATLHFLASMLRSHTGRKQKAIFLLDSGACFSVLPFSPGSRSNDRSYRSGQIWLAPRAIVYLASGLLLGRPPFLSLFPHSTSVPSGMGFTISIKGSNSLPPRQLSLLPPPSGTKRFHSVD